jgi:hypothetical protein
MIYAITLMLKMKNYGATVIDIMTLLENEEKSLNKGLRPKKKHKMTGKLQHSYNEKMLSSIK